MQYTFSASANNGKISSETDVASGETVTYTYDSLNRLASATSSVNPGWGQSFGYDGFGNLTNVNVTKGTAPSLSVTYNASTNRRSTDTADANGNLYANGVTTYDVANRVTAANISGGTARYSYAPNNQRIWRGTWSTQWNGSQWVTTQTADEITFYSPSGAKLAAYNVIVWGTTEYRAVSTGYYEYFGGKLLKNAQGWVNQDRLGSVGKYFPYGQERPSSTANGTEKFATYFRDAETGLDYAQNRYHSPGDGRFLSPDPYQASAGVEDPGSWNRYAYVGGDPINLTDPLGLCTFTATGGTNVPGSVPSDCSVTVTANTKPSPTKTLPLPVVPYYNAQYWNIDYDYCMLYAEECRRQAQEQEAANAQCQAGYVKTTTGCAEINASDCALSALYDNGIAVALDVVGFALPGGNGLATNLAQMAVGFASTINAATNQENFIDTVSALGNLINVQVSTYAWSLSVIRGTAGYLPFIGNFLSAISAVGDVYAAWEDFDKCMHPTTQ